jgi:hypothetical protein
MSLSKADQARAVSNAKNEIAAFSDMYNRCGFRLQCARTRCLISTRSKTRETRSSQRVYQALLVVWICLSIYLLFLPKEKGTVTIHTTHNGFLALQNVETVFWKMRRKLSRQRPVAWREHLHWQVGKGSGKKKLALVDMKNTRHAIHWHAIYSLVTTLNLWHPTTIHCIT